MNKSTSFQTRYILFLILFIILYIIFISTQISHALSENDMRNPTILTNEGWAYFWKGGTQNLIKAEEYFQKALNLNIYNADAVAGLGKLAMEKDHRPYTKYNKDNCRKALALFDRGISFDSRSYRSYYYKGEALLCLEDYDAALIVADLIEDRNRCSSHYIKAKAYKGKYLSKNDPADKTMAIVESTDYLECSQSNTGSGNLRSALDLFRDIMRTTKDFDATEKYFKRNIELKPHLFWSYHNYYNIIILRTAEGYLKDTDLPEVERIIKKGKSNTGLKIGSTSELNFYRANVFFEKKEYAKALYEYTDSLAGNPNPIHSSVREKMSFLCSQFTDDRCRKSWQKIIQAYLDRGDCTNAAKEYELQYAGNNNDFVHMKDAVSKCKDKKN